MGKSASVKWLCAGGPRPYRDGRHALHFARAGRLLVESVLPGLADSAVPVAVAWRELP